MSGPGMPIWHVRLADDTNAAPAGRVVWRGARVALDRLSPRETTRRINRENLILSLYFNMIGQNHGPELSSCNARTLMYSDEKYIRKTMPRPRGKQLPNRLCVSLDNETYAGLCTLSRDQGVSASWLVRRAVQTLVAQHSTRLLPELPLERSVGTRRASVT